MAHHDFWKCRSRRGCRCARLRVGDTVTLENTLFGIRDATLIAHVRPRRADALDLQGPCGDPHRAERAARCRSSAENPAGYAPICVGTTTSHAHGALHAAADGARGRAHHHRQGRHGRRSLGSVRRTRRRLSRDRSAARRRWRRRGSRRSRMSISTTSIPKACGGSASRTSARCWWRWIRMAARSIATSDEAAQAGAMRSWRASARLKRHLGMDRHRHRHPDSRRRRRRAVRGAAREAGRSRCSTSRRREGPARQVRLHAHGAGRLQRRAGARRFRRAPFHGHDRRRQVAERPGSRVDAGHRSAHVRIRELENELGCFFDRNPDGTIHQKAFAGQTFDRTVHKGDLTGIEIINRLAEQVWRRDVQAAGGASRARFHPGGRRLGPRRRADARHAHRASRCSCARRRRCSRPAAGRRCTNIIRRRATSPATAWRWRCAPGLPLRDMEMVQFHPTGLLAGAGTRMTGTVLEEGLRGAGG